MEQQKMERGLKPRHVEMIALGGTIGVGLFMGSANTIQMAGPSVLLCYAVTGVVMFFIMRIMGEMLYQEPVTGSFATYGHKYISPFVGYLTACSYWFLWVVVGLSEITAVGIYVHYWFPLLPQLDFGPGRHWPSSQRLIWQPSNTTVNLILVRLD